MVYEMAGSHVNNDPGPEQPGYPYAPEIPAQPTQSSRRRIVIDYPRSKRDKQIQQTEYETKERQYHSGIKTAFVLICRSDICFQ
jgi:hypothetical protein